MMAALLKAFGPRKPFNVNKKAVKPQRFNGLFVNNMNMILVIQKSLHLFGLFFHIQTAIDIR